jgi:hypothetical protein
VPYHGRIAVEGTSSRTRDEEVKRFLARGINRWRALDPHFNLSRTFRAFYSELTISSFTNDDYPFESAAVRGPLRRDYRKKPASISLFPISLEPAHASVARARTPRASCRRVFPRVPQSRLARRISTTYFRCCVTEIFFNRKQELQNLRPPRFSISRPTALSFPSALSMNLSRCSMFHPQQGSAKLEYLTRRLKAATRMAIARLAPPQSSGTSEMIMLRLIGRDD